MGKGNGAMGEDVARPRLGRGLAALIGDFGDAGMEGHASAQRKAPVEFLRPNPRNPRRRFSETELEELAASIRLRGVIQPIVVRALANVPGTYEIVAGERRWRASQRANLTEVPICVVEVDDRTSLEYAILENVQRADLNAIEEATGYERLMEEFRYTQSELAEILGKSRSHLANTLRLLQLSPAIQERVVVGEITAGHARALLAVRDPEAVAARIVVEGLSVREVEALASAEVPAEAGPRPGRPRRRPEVDATLKSFAQTLEKALGLGVAVKPKGTEAGEIRIRYGTAQELEVLCRRLSALREA